MLHCLVIFCPHLPFYCVSRILSFFVLHTRARTHTYTPTYIFSVLSLLCPQYKCRLHYFLFSFGLVFLPHCGLGTQNDKHFGNRSPPVLVIDAATLKPTRNKKKNCKISILLRSKRSSGDRLTRMTSGGKLTTLYTVEEWIRLDNEWCLGSVPHSF